ncbi:hypothetical protein [Leptolyngbya sp. FACHB-17]|uniref:hypothetical protein n=1 Tax=unclassified Leptolyngbya TaxID=2650499 RepID=UPI0016811A67|nr:hypothetical protein [Leptolyngbya sp. FACHB-17]MBD2083368.1 hypothetical protein [Leptolyngbya sp. FACHB-17]
MALKELRIAHVLLPDEDWDRLMLACDELGYNKSSILKNALQGYFRRNRDFYIYAGIKDAEARGISSSEHFQILRDKSEDDLPSYTRSLVLDKQDPLTLENIIAIPNDKQFRRAYNTIEISAFNFALLRVGHIVHRDSYPQMVGRMVRWHLLKNWAEAYLPQIELDKKNDYQ